MVSLVLTCILQEGYTAVVLKMFLSFTVWKENCKEFPSFTGEGFL